MCRIARYEFQSSTIGGLGLLTFEEASRLFAYDPETGSIKWRETVNSRALAWTEAGGVSGHGYIKVQWSGKNYSGHKLAWLLSTGSYPPPGLQIDHINSIRTDNRIANLRLATIGQNAMNKVPFNATGFKGVRQRGKRFCAQFRYGSKVKYLGTFDTPEAAHAAWVKESVAFHGEFSRAA